MNYLKAGRKALETIFILAAGALALLAVIGCGAADLGPAPSPTPPPSMFSTLPTTESPAIGDQPGLVINLGATATPEPTGTPQPTYTPGPTPTPYPTPNPALQPTYTPGPTPTPYATPTPAPQPTYTPVPTPTAAPVPTQAPVSYSKPRRPAYVEAEYKIGMTHIRWDHAEGVEW